MPSVNLGRVGLVLKGTWDSTTTYVPLDLVSYDGNAWAAKRQNTNVTPNTTNSDDWQLISNNADLVATVQGYKEDAEAAAASAALSASAGEDAIANEANAFSTSKNYAAGDYVIYNNGAHRYLYRFTADHAAGSWTGTDAVQVVVTDGIANLESAIDNNYYAKLTALGTENKVAFQINSGDTINIRTADSSNFTVEKLNMLDANDDVVGFYNLSSLNLYSRTVTVDADCVAVALSGGTAQDIVIINHSKIMSEALSKTKILENGEDLNSLFVSGWFVGSYAHTYLHAPESATGSKMVFVFQNSSTSSNSQWYMIYVNFTANTKYERLYSEGSWSDWKPLMDYRVKNLSNGDDLDALYLNGPYGTSYAHSYLHSPDGAVNNRREIWIYGGTNNASALRYMHYYNYTTNRSYVRLYHDGAWDDWQLETGGVSSGDSLISGAAYNVRFPLNDTYGGSGEYDPYSYHQKVVTILHCSDIHSHAGEFQTLMGWANDNTSLYDDILFTGDIVEYYDETTGIDYMAFWKAVNNAEKVLVTIGNHDAKNQPVSSVPNWERKTMARSRELYMYGIENWGVTSPTGKTYWYKDYSNSDLRLIGLDTTVVAGGADDSAQQTWLANVLADAKTNSKQVVITEHYQPESAIKIASDFTATNRAVSYNANMAMPTAYYGIVDSFISGGGAFICWLCGHTHTDYIAYNSNYPGQIFFVVTSLWNDLRTSDQARTPGTPSFIAANLIGFDTERKLIKIARVGANCDYDLRPRETLVYNYETKTIVRQASGD